MVVTPPAAADRLADFSVSLGSAPGSPVRTRMSISPGDRHSPRASTISEADTATDPRSTAVMTPSSTTTEPGPS